MKQSEKLDRILHGLYEHKDEEAFYPLWNIFNQYNIEANDVEFDRLINRLCNDELLFTLPTSNFDRVRKGRITSHGIDYCEDDSYTNKGHSLLNSNLNITIRDSKNVSIVNGSPNTSIINYVNAKETIGDLRKALEDDICIQAEKKQSMVECLDEVEAVINAGKVPKSSLKDLLGMASDITTIAPPIYMLLKALGSVFNINVP